MTPQLFVGIGASAGGLDALKRFFDAAPIDRGVAYFLVQHLSPDFESVMDELLERHTSMPLRQAGDGVVVEADTIYLLPPRKEMRLEGDRLRLQDRASGHALPLPIDVFFHSLAQAGDRAVGVILSGTGSDGSRGLPAIAAAGGHALVQDPASAQFDGMPRAALGACPGARVASAEELPGLLFAAESIPPGLADRTSAGPYAAILERLLGAFDLDFSAYRTATVDRRIERRMAFASLTDPGAYVDYLESHPQEIDDLYRDLLIGVTEFFRDDQAFEALREKVIPEILQRLDIDEEIRIWVAGCATGEEAYSLAMAFTSAARAISRPLRLRIFATDVHQGSIDQAAAGWFPREATAPLPSALVESYFTPQGDGLLINKELRHTIVFAQHDLLQDPPFNRLHLISCRNMLIYLKPAAQKRAISRLHYSLASQGVLFLGSSESLGDLEMEFDPIDSKARLFRKRRDVRLPGSQLIPQSPSLTVDRLARQARPALPSETRGVGLLDIYDELLGRFMPPGLLLASDFSLLHIFGDAGRFLQMPAGRPREDVLSMLPEALRLPVGGAARRALRSQESTRCSVENLDVTVTPVAGRTQDGPHLLLTFVDAAEQPESMQPMVAVDPDEASRQHISDLEQELHDTREHLQITIEELEASNEEMQSSNEELVAANEELQSTNEELHSVNEELYTVNREHEEKIRQLIELNDDLDNLMHSTQVGIAFLDESLQIRRLTPRLSEQISLREQDVGRSINDVAHLFGGPGLTESLAQVVGQGTRFEQELEADGGWLLLRAHPYRNSHGATAGVTLATFDITEMKSVESALVDARNQLQATIDALSAHIVVLDDGGGIIAVNEAWRAFGRDNGWTGTDFGVGSNYLTVCEQAARDGDEVADAIGAGLRALLAGTQDRFDSEYPCHSPRRERWFRLQATRFDREGRTHAVIAHQDVSDLIEGERRLRQFQKMQAVGQLTAGVAHNFNNILQAVMANLALVRRDVPFSRQDLIDDALEASRQGAEIVSQLMAFSRDQRNQQGDDIVDIGRLVLHVGQLCDGIFDRRIQFSVEMDDGLPGVAGSASQLEQVLLNLAVNARDAVAGQAADRQRIAITARSASNFDGTRDRGMVRIRVEDSGVGMSAETMERIFEPFYTTKEVGEGTGLGLSTAYSIVEDHGGQILCDSVVGEGTRFDVLLPASGHVPRVEPDAPDRGETELSPRGLAILIVDDDDIVRRSLRRLLEADGHRVWEHASGAAALAWIDGGAPPIDAALVDVSMPGPAGSELARELRQRRVDLPVVLVTGHAHHDGSGLPLLRKPILLEDLHAILGRLLSA